MLTRDHLADLADRGHSLYQTAKRLDSKNVRSPSSPVKTPTVSSIDPPRWESFQRRICVIHSSLRHVYPVARSIVSSLTV